MKRESVCLSSILFGVLVLLATDASAQLFGGGDDEKMELLLREVKKLNTRIVEKVIPKINQTQEELNKLKNDMNWVKSEVKILKSENKNMNQQMEIMANMIPAMQATMERGQADTSQQIQALGKNITQLEGRITQQVGGAIQQSVGSSITGLKDSMAKDMEKMAKLNQDSFKELIGNNQKNMGSMEKQIEAALNSQNTRMDKSISVMTEIAKSGSKDSETLASVQAGLVENSKALSEQNKKIIDILAKSLKEQETAANKMDSLGGNQAKADENVKLARETMVALKGILDKRLEEINKTQQSILTQSDLSAQNTNLLKENLLVADQKINKLAAGLQTIQTQNLEVSAHITQAQTQITRLQDLNIETDQKFATLIDTTKSMLTNAGEVNKKVDSSMMKLDESRTEIDLTSEKITKLIEILKAIAEEQGKLEQLITSHAGEGGNKDVLEKLEDLRRKANVSIARTDSILKKLRGN